MKVKKLIKSKIEEKQDYKRHLFTTFQNRNYCTMKKGMKFLGLFMLSLLLLFSQCMFDDADSLYDRPAYVSAVKVYGIVNDKVGNPISDVRIKAESGSGQIIYAYTDSMGFFNFDHVRARDNRIVLEADKEGYFHKSFAATSSNKNAKVRFVMSEKTTTTILSNTENIVTISENAAVYFEANSFVTEAGTPYNGEVQVAYTYADPQSPIFSLIMQGGDLRGVNNNGQEQHLVSYGAMAVELTSASGATLELAEGQTATIEMIVPESQLSNAPATIPLWYFDDVKNVWVEDGFATLQGNKYIGQVSHFTWWNCDDPISPNTFVTGKVFDCYNNPLEGIAVSVGPIIVYTNSDGIYFSNVASDLSFYVEISPLLNVGMFSIPILVSGVPEGTTMTLENIIIPCSATISGTTNRCLGSDIFVEIQTSGYWSDFKSISESSDNFILPVFSGQPFSLTFKIHTPPLWTFYEYSVPALSPEQNYTLPEIIAAACPGLVSGKLVNCTDSSISGVVYASFTGIPHTITVGSDGLYSFYVPSGSNVSITASHIFPSGLIETLTTTAQINEGSNSYDVPPLQFSCPSTLSGVVTTCSGTPITTTVKISLAGQSKFVLAVGGNFTAIVPGEKEINISAQEFVGGSNYSGQTLVNSINNELVIASLQLCTLEFQTECPVAGLQFTGNGLTFNFPNLFNYNTANQITLPLTTATPGVHALTPFDVPAGYTLVQANDGPVRLSILLPQPIQTGTYNIGMYAPVAFGHPIGVMLLNNSSPTFILTEGQINVTQASETTLAGNFIGSVGSLTGIGIGQLAAPNNFYEVTGYFCLTY